MDRENHTHSFQEIVFREDIPIPPIIREAMFPHSSRIHVWSCGSQNISKDVNYHSEAGYLYGAIQELKSGNHNQPFQAEKDLEDFNNECTKTLTGWNA